MSVLDDVATLIDDLDMSGELGPLVVERRGQPVLNSRGAFEPDPAPVLLNLEPWVAHNVTGRDLDILPKADRNSEVVQFYARDGSFPGVNVGFRVGDKGSGADVVRYNDRRFRMAKVRDFSKQGLVWCALGVLMETQVT